MTTRVDGADGKLTLPSALVLYWKGTANMNIAAREFDGRATGDNTAIQKSGSGLTTDSNITIDGVMLDDWTALQLLIGTEVTATLEQGATTVFQGTVIIRATLGEPAADMATANLVLIPQAMPTIPVFTIGGL